MQNLLNDLKDTLKKDERIFVDGKILKNKLTELALKFDDQLITLLLGNKDIKEKFFIDKKIKENNIFLFNKDEFVKFVNNKEFLPDSFTTFKNFIGLQQNDEYLKDAGDVVLVWPYKDCVLEGGQEKEDDKRDEIFYNETLAPDEISRLFDKKVLSNFRKFDSKNIKDGIKDFEISDSDNFVIKGNNLLVLHAIQEKFRNKVKLIYIDPPYNTGNDTFQYNDKFNRSAWLTFMKNRLEVAKDLLRDDGSIAISIDHHENHSLKFILQEIFGAENFIQDVVVETSSPAGFKLVNPGPVKVTEYVLFYAKNKKLYLNTEKKLFVEDKTSDVYSEIILNPKESSNKWKFSSFDKYVYEKLEVESLKELKKKYNENLAQKIFETTKRELAIEYADSLFTTYKPDNPSKALQVKVAESKKNPSKCVEYNSVNDTKYYLKNGRIMAFYKTKLRNVNGEKVPTKHLTNLWTDISWSGITNEGGVLLNKAKKPEAMLRRIIDLSTNENDLVMDFFAGSGTTLAVAHKMNRKYIGVEQMDYIHDLPEARLKNVIKGDQTGISELVGWKSGGSFVYVELKEWNEKYISDIQKADTSQKLLNIYDVMKNEAFFRYDVNHKNFDKNEFKKLTIKEQKDILINCLDKNHLYVNYSEINDKIYKIPEDEKLMNKKFYGK